jgi:dipeptidyl aminopeptidase/acylaminoacyl peptidase
MRCLTSHSSTVDDRFGAGSAEGAYLLNELLAQDTRNGRPGAVDRLPPMVRGYRDFRPEVRLQLTLSMSGDGSTVAFADDSAGRFNVAVADVAGGAPRYLTLARGRSVRLVNLRPDGQALAYLADRDGDERWQLYTTGLDDTAPVAVTDTPSAQYGMPAGGPYSPDGRHLAFTGNDRAPQAQDVLVADLATGEIRRVLTTGGWLFAGHWAPDGSRLSVVEWVEPGSRHEVYVVPAHGGSAVRLTSDDARGTFALGPWLADGSGFLVRSSLGRDFVGLARMDASTGELSWLDTPDWDVDEVSLSADGRIMAWLVNVGGRTVLRLRDLGSGTDLPAPGLPTGAAEQLCVSADGRLLAMLFSTPTRPRAVLVVDVDTGASRFLVDPAPAGATADAMAAPTVVTYKTTGDLDVPAVLYRPAVRPIGVVIAVHGGPDTQEKLDYRYDGFYQYLVSLGVAVFAPNFRGSSGYGLRYRRLLDRRWGVVDLEDISAAVAYLREQDWVDPDRIALYGGSYGGFVVLSCLARLPHLRWAAGVSVCGISNLVTIARSSPPTWRPRVVSMIGDPETEADDLLSRSPVTFADAIRAPLFVIQGANDSRVNRDESDQIVGRLRTRGVDVRYDVYDDEGHAFTGSANQIQAREDSARFLVDHLEAPPIRI